jgi:hypothetical protein
MAFIESGDVAGHRANVNSDKEMLTALSKVLGNAGLAALVTQNHDGLSGLPKLQRALRASIDRRLIVGVENQVWDDEFSGANVNVTTYQAFATTMTIVQASGFLTLNNGASVASAAAAAIRTWRTFHVSSNYSTSLDFTFALALVPQAQNIIQIGCGLNNNATTYAATDGVYLEIDTAGALQLVVNFNGSVTTSGPITFSWTANTFYSVSVVLNADRCELWINGVLYAAVNRPTTSGTTSIIQTGRLFARLINNAATSGAQKLLLARWGVAYRDPAMNRSWGAAMTGMGRSLVSTPDGPAAGTLANIANSAAPASATLSNTAAGYTTLGGNWQFAAVAGAETDYALFGYQVPAMSATQLGNNLMLTGVRIETFNMGAAVATTPTLLNWFLGVGGSAVSLATADSATAGGRAARRIALGVQSLPIGTVVGGAVAPIDIKFPEPIMVEPDSFVHLILRMPVGTATASQIVRGMATFLGYFE